MFSCYGSFGQHPLRPGLPPLVLLGEQWRILSGSLGLLEEAISVAPGVPGASLGGVSECGVRSLFSCSSLPSQG